MDKEFAEHFARRWLDAWNAHDLDRILDHYADNFEMASPAITQILKEPSGMLYGKEAVRNYWTKALALVPDLKFELQATLLGVDSIILCYRGARGRMVSEVFYFGSDKQVIRAEAHYEV
ncbi:MAG: nuclear transport factor 2 family protein [Limnohabitans sp.]